MARLAAALFTMLALSGTAAAAPLAPAKRDAAAARLKAPTSLHAFLPQFGSVGLKTSGTTFPRTPAFAWRPVRGATRYELMLSTSKLFRTNGIIWDDRTLTTPVAALPIALPWVDGNLYARVRGIWMSGATGPWSSPYLFDIHWTGDGIPKQLQSMPPGLVGWEKIDGATSYEVWYLNAPTTAPAPSLDFSGNGGLSLAPFDLSRPAMLYWTNDGGLMQIFNGVLGVPVNSTSANGQTYMPAGHYVLQVNAIGNWTIQIVPESSTGAPTPDIFSTTAHVADEREFYTSHQSSPWIDTVKWRVRAVREVYGSLANGLPRVSYGPWSDTYTNQNPAFATGTLDSLSTRAEPIVSGSGTNTDAYYETTPGFAFRGNSGLAGAANHYRVYVFTDRACVNNVFDGLPVGSPAYAPRSAVRPQWSFVPGENIEGNPVPARELQGPASFDPNPVPATTSGASASSSPASSGGGVNTGALQGRGAPIGLWDTDGPDGSSSPAGRYYWTVVTVSDEGRDTELPQDVCQKTSRWGSFGIASHQIQVADKAKVPYAWGLSANGSLAAATSKRRTFYGAPLIGWTASRDANEYEVEWSRTAYPWRRTGNLYTFSTATTLPLKPGVWYYRVRGIDMSLPTGASTQAWSQPARIVIAKPKFKVIGGGK
jgi:hypothetical protein